MDEANESCAVCNNANDARFMIDCDRCHRWFHGNCVGVDQDNFSGTWFCDQCLVMQQIESVKKRPVTAVRNNPSELTPIRKKARSRLVRWCIHLS
jgi:late competence protein required for DNA uptake (superfamily II DNA/RNA helicase)